MYQAPHLCHLKFQSFAVEDDHIGGIEYPLALAHANTVICDLSPLQTDGLKYHTGVSAQHLPLPFLVLKQMTYQFHRS
jgi:hypothetical protein